MAAEIQVAHSSTAKTLYAFIRNSVGQIYNGSTFESYTTGNILNYDVAMAEQGTASRYYVGTFPALAAGVYAVTVYEQAGGSPAEGDTLVAAGNIDWSGTVVKNLSTVTVTSVGTDAINAASIATDAIGAAEIAHDAATEIGAESSGGGGGSSKPGIIG